METTTATCESTTTAPIQSTFRAHVRGVYLSIKFIVIRERTMFRIVVAQKTWQMVDDTTSQATCVEFFRPEQTREYDESIRTYDEWNAELKERANEANRHVKKAKKHKAVKPLLWSVKTEKFKAEFILDGDGADDWVPLKFVSAAAHST